jgi:hypothetical protein
MRFRTTPGVAPGRIVAGGRTVAFLGDLFERAPPTRVPRAEHYPCGRLRVRRVLQRTLAGWRLPARAAALGAVRVRPAEQGIQQNVATQNADGQQRERHVQHLVCAPATHYFGSVSASAEFFTTTILKVARKGSPERFVRNLLRRRIAAHVRCVLRKARVTLRKNRGVARHLGGHVGAVSSFIHACSLAGPCALGEFLLD